MSRIGYPWHFLLRDILQFDDTLGASFSFPPPPNLFPIIFFPLLGIDWVRSGCLDDAVNRMANAARTCNIYVGVGDGNVSYILLKFLKKRSLTKKLHTIVWPIPIVRVWLFETHDVQPPQHSLHPAYL